ncbi:hypothetical protein Tco_0851295, partial [Tanacetum coccineum]
ISHKLLVHIHLQIIAYRQLQHPEMQPSIVGPRSWDCKSDRLITAYCVCDDPDYFYDYVQGLLDGLEAGVQSRDIVKIENAKGVGYAMSTSEELKFVKEVAESTGVILDPACL